MPCIPTIRDDIAPVVSYRVRTAEPTTLEGGDDVIAMPIWDTTRPSSRNEGSGRCTLQQSHGLVLCVDVDALSHMATHGNPHYHTLVTNWNGYVLCSLMCSAYSRQSNSVDCVYAPWEC